MSFGSVAEVRWADKLRGPWTSAVGQTVLCLARPSGRCPPPLGCTQADESTSLFSIRVFSFFLFLGPSSSVPSKEPLSENVFTYMK